MLGAVRLAHADRVFGGGDPQAISNFGDAMIDRRTFVKGVAGAAGLYSLRVAASRAELDLALENGRFWTGKGTGTTTDAVGIRGGRIVALGKAKVRALSGRGTQWVDLKGAFGMPAFADSHTHFLAGSEVLSQPDLLGARNQAEFAQRIGAAASANPDRWILGGTWDEQRMGGTCPLAPGSMQSRPIRPWRCRARTCTACSSTAVALRLANITRDTPDPAGGVIERDKDGHPWAFSRTTRRRSSNALSRRRPTRKWMSRYAGASNMR